MATVATAPRTTWGRRPEAVSPAPTETIDSPNAMIIRRPWRSTKCDAPSANGLARASSPPTRNSTSGARNSTHSSQPVANPAAMSSSAATAFSGPTRSITRTEPRPPRAMNSPEWMITTVRYATPNSTPDPVNTSGMASDSTRKAAIAAMSSSRTGTVSGTA